MSHSFTAIDFETAQGYRWSICQVGLVRVENGIITQEINLLVQPPDNYYWQRFTEIHGISARDTINAPTFDQIWHKIAPFIENQTVIAHNGFGFDFPVLSKTLEHYGMSAPDYNKYCTYKIFRSNLATLCQEHNIPLNHHDALSDAKACAELYLKHLKNRV
ncbi:3'-5' exonuclease [Flavobacterium sp. LS2P90]|uniref:3'-5' exonuclease n=1 Tax=Flavobacterium xylosi TaxID=3230415 RepID=A0ABW6HYB8_9FLAO